MKSDYLKVSIFSGFIIFTVLLLLTCIIFLCFSLRQSDIAAKQAIVAQRVLLCSIHLLKSEQSEDSCDVGGGKPKTFAELLPSCESCKSEVLLDLKLLLQGGVFLGENLPRIESPEIEKLLEKLRSFWRSFLSPDEISIAESLPFYHHSKNLHDALLVRAHNLQARIWAPLWSSLTLALLLVISILLGFSPLGRRWFMFGYLPDEESSSYGLENQLLLLLPVPVILLDKFLNIKFLNRPGEKYFGQFSPIKELSFDDFCCDQNLSNQLRSSFVKTFSTNCEVLETETEKLFLQTAGGSETLVEIKWFKLYLGGRDYLLGMISTLPENGRENVRLEMTPEQLQELSQNLFRVQDDERQHLADELHDGLCQSLAALKMQINYVEKRIEDEKLSDDCRKARQFIAQIIEDTRRLSHDLSPMILDDLGLGGALTHLVNNFAALNDLKVSVVMPDLRDLFTNDSARNIYRIVQEAVNNVAKHAQASMLVLEVKIVDEAVSFLIQDDGVGFGSSMDISGRAKAGLGLTSMAQRVKLLGGNFEISANSGEGCSVTFTLPVKGR